MCFAFGAVFFVSISLPLKLLLLKKSFSPFGQKRPLQQLSALLTFSIGFYNKYITSLLTQRTEHPTDGLPIPSRLTESLFGSLHVEVE